MRAKLLETVVYEGKRYVVGETYNMSPEVFNAIYPSARYLEDDMSILKDYIHLDVDYTKYWTYPMDGYGRLNRFFSSNFTFNHKSDIHFFCGTPTIMSQQKELNKKKVLLTMFESNRLPKDWVKYVNMADVVIVPSNFCRDVFVNSGVITRIEVVPLFYIPCVIDNVKRKDETFTFGHQNAFVMGHQKGDDVLVRAFIKAFGTSKDVKLLLKGRKHHYQALDHDFIAMCEKQPNIDVVLADYEDDEVYSEFYMQIDCFVFTSRGEGFGIPPLEALSIGLPTIATDGHSLADYSQYFVPVKTKGLCDSFYVGRVKDSKNSYWQEIDEKHLVKQLLEVKKNYNDYKYQAFTQMQDVHEMYSPEAFAQRLLNVFDSL